MERLGCAVEVPVKDQEDVTGAEEKWTRVKNEVMHECHKRASLLSKSGHEYI